MAFVMMIVGRAFPDSPAADIVYRPTAKRPERQTAAINNTAHLFSASLNACRKLAHDDIKVTECVEGSTAIPICCAKP